MKKNLYLLLLLMLLPLAVHADDSGPCGDKVSYVFEEATGTLTISGTGAMADYSYDYSAPWSSYCGKIKKVVLNEGVTSIGDYAFLDCCGLTSIEIPNSVTSIGDYAFYYCSGLTSIVIPNSVTSIGTRAFFGCRGLTSIEIPNSVTSIGDYAFFGCSGLTSIEIPNSVTSIGSYAFESCRGLTSIVIPNSVTSIGDYAFRNCSGLTSINVESGNTKYDSRDNCNAIIEASSNTLIAGCKNTTIPNSVTSIGAGAFWGRSGLTSIEIPNSVTSIGTRAFSGCSGLTSIEIPNSVTSIGNYAFSGCSGLTSINVESGNTKYDSRDNCNAIIEISSNTLIAGCKNTTIPNSVTRIGNYAFYYCSSLTSIVIPNSVTRIGNSAFSGCSGLTSVTCLAKRVPTITSNAFTDSPISSATLSVPAGSKAAYEAAYVWKDFKKTIEINDSGSCGDKLSYVFEVATGTLTISGTGAMQNYSNSSSAPWSSYKSDIKKLVLNEGMTSIGNYAFYYCSGLTSIEIPNSVTSIGDYAFSGCSGLTSIEIPNSVTSIGEAAFGGCSGLTSIEIPNSVTSIGNSAFSGCNGLTSIEIPNSVTSIGNYAFYNCSGLTSIEIPNSVTSIGNYAFYNCSGLTSIEIPNSVTSIGSYAFEYCRGLTSINVESGNTKYDSRDNCNAIIEASSNTLIAGCKNTIIPNSVTSIGTRAFSGCSGLTSIEIPNSVTSIGTRAFSGCSGLTSINVESGNTKYDSRDNCNAIIEISSNTLIAGCKSTIIPNSVTSIGNYAFYYCSSLTSIVIPNSVTSIGSGAFSDCSGLTSIVIPNSVTNIGSYAFESCSGLTSVTCLAEGVPTIRSDVFYNSPISSATLYVPVGSKAAYEVADYWKDFKEIIEINDYGSCGDKLSYVFEKATGTLTISGTGAMSDYKSHPLVPWYLYRNSIKKVVLNNGVTTIGDYAFSGCSGLTSVDIPNSVTSIGYEAFSGCSGLTSIEIPKSVTSIRSSAFIYCSSLTSIKVESGNTTYDSRNNCNAIIETSGNTLITGCKKTIIPNSVTSIGQIAFLGCSGLTTIEIPSSVTSIGNEAFEYCSGLTSTVISNSVTTIGRFAFDGCGNLTSVDIPNSVTSIGSNAFQGCFGLISIVIPNSVTTIGEGAFSNCTSLTSIKVESGNTTYDSRNNCNAIIETSSSTLIAGCKNTVIPNSVTSIGDHTFRGCSGLTSMVIPNSVTSIGFSAFNGCSGLTSIEIPNSVTSIGEWAFLSCSGLTSIEIPNSVTSIGSYAFYDCSGLTSVTCLAESVPTTDSNAFYNSPISSATLYVPEGCKVAYEAADVWKDFKEIVEIEVAPTPSSDALISVQDTKAYIGKTVSVDIDLNNSTEDLTAYQFDLTLPDGLSLSVNDKGKFLVTKTSRYEDDSHTLNISRLEGNTYRFVCFSMSNEVITGTSGAILNASLTIGESVNEGSYEATISNIVVTKTDGTQLKLSDSKFNIVVTDVIKGDANGDGEVNVSDIVEIVNYIMNKPSDKFVFAAADVNEDGEVNVTDIVKVVSIIMSANSSQAKMSAAQTEMTDNDQVQLVDNEDQTISLTLNNEGGYVASQFDLVLSDNQSLESITLNNNRTDNHILTYTKTGENRYRVLSYSLNNATYDGHSGELLDIKVAGNGDVSVEDILFVTAEETEKRFSPLHSGTTGISVTTKQAEAMDIYSVDGSLVHKQAKSMDGLERGIYIINGKKHIVR